MTLDTEEGLMLSFLLKIVNLCIIVGVPDDDIVISLSRTHDHIMEEDIIEN